MPFQTLAFQLSFLLQAVGAVLVALAWYRALQEQRQGLGVPRTRLIMFIITSVALAAYVIPSMLSICYFVEGCWQPAYRDYLRIFSGLILFLYGLFKFLLYYTKEVENSGKHGR